jgi:XrtJ-associated TM-motif-TM protein
LLRIEEAARRLKEKAMMRRGFFLLGLMVAAAALPLRAQTGCVDSPEDPTIVLALVSGIGAVAVSSRTARGRKSE